MSKVFSSSDSVFDWLEQFINLERGQKPKSFRLDRMQFLCELAGHPECCAPSIHTAGSKGKGSVTAMLAAMLTSAGYRAARYMSPHVTNIRERITCGDTFFDEDVYCTAGNVLREITDKILPSASNPLFDESAADGCQPTYFELLTLYFFLCAKYGKCDVIVAETGMGGRLDCTNVLDPLVSIITLIELEHTAFLGNTIAKIANEKAGIIKQNKPVILAEQCSEALEVFIKIAKQKGSPLLYLPQIVKTSGVKVHNGGTNFTIVCENYSNTLSIPIPGKVQAENAALAVTALKTAFPQIKDDAICAGLSNLKIPGRFERISENPLFIIDGAHTPRSMELCTGTFCTLYGEHGVLIFGCAADKDADAMAKIAGTQFAKIIITTPGAFRTSRPQKVYEAFASIAGAEKTLLIEDTQEAVRVAHKLAQKNNIPVLGAGSFYLVCEIRRMIAECFYI